MLENLVNAIIDLLKVKTILSLMVLTTTCVLAFKGLIDMGAFLTIASAIITYYFTRKE